MRTHSRIQFGYVQALDAMLVAFVDRYGRPLWLQDGNGGAALVATGMMGAARKDQLEREFARVDEVFRELS